MGVEVAVTLLAFVGILCRDLPVYSVMGADETGERCGAGDGGGTGLGSWETWIQLEEERKDREWPWILGLAWGCL